MRLFLLIVFCSAAHADALETFGFTARAIGQAGALTAGSSGAVAAWHNPGAVAFSDDVELSLGYSYAHLGLRIDGQDARVTAAHGISLGIALPLRLWRVTVAFGLALYLPDQVHARIELVPAAETTFALLGNSMQRIVVVPSLSLRILPWLSIGGGVTILTDVAGAGIHFDVGISDSGKVGQGEVDVSLPLRAAPTIGVAMRIGRHAEVGAIYRGDLDLRLRLGVLASVQIAQAVTGTTNILLQASNFYSPQRVALGVGLSPVENLWLRGEISWLNWSAYRQSTPQLNVDVNLSVSPPLLPSVALSVPFRDTWTLHVGVEWQRDLRRVTFALRGGYAFEPSPLQSFRGLPLYADNDRHIVAVGGGVTLPHLLPILKKALSFDVALQIHALIPRRYEKDPQLGGVGFSSDGYLLNASATTTVSF